ncbi:hypothetical protein PR048_025224 [Dryococelus australis]|uniref:Uncharacterized protein n=1 Tax=Dryococelus australis TaxID=614101 RepID=A0ABQ9GQS8_9NEOP|nr:hypothetical protein PR048_025224 [Dryococelus australis]
MKRQPLEHTVLGTSWRTPAQSSPSTVTADSQCAVDIAVAERLALSPPTKAIRAQSPAEPPDSRMWESCRTMSLVGGSSRGTPASPAPQFRHRSILNPIAHIGSEDLAFKSRPNLFNHSIHGFFTKLSDSHKRKSDSGPAGDRTRNDLVVERSSCRSTTTALILDIIVYPRGSRDLVVIATMTKWTVNSNYFGCEIKISIVSEAARLTLVTAMMPYKQLTASSRRPRVANSVIQRWTQFCQLQKPREVAAREIQNIECVPHVGGIQ